MHSYCTLLHDYKHGSYDTCTRCQSFCAPKGEINVATLCVHLVRDAHIGTESRLTSRFPSSGIQICPFFLPLSRGYDAFSPFLSRATLHFSRKTICGRYTGFAPSSALTTHFLLPNDV